jgi:hypothetical protein
MAAQSNNAFKDVGHLVKFNGENYSDYRCEFLAMMEQLDLKLMLDANTDAGEQVEARPAEVISFCFKLRKSSTYSLHVVNTLKLIVKT